jgi:hypothetical protein
MSTETVGGSDASEKQPNTNIADTQKALIPHFLPMRWRDKAHRIPFFPDQNPPGP